MTRLELIRKLHRKRKTRAAKLPKVDPEAERELRAEEPEEQEAPPPAVVDKMEGCAL